MSNEIELAIINIDELYKKHKSRLLSFIKRKIGGEEDAEDILQLTYLEAIRCKESFSGNSKPETWLFGIAINLIRNFYKKRFNAPVLEDINSSVFLDFENDFEDDPCLLTEVTISLNRVLNDISLLPKQTQSIFECIIENDMSYQDTAQMVGVPVGTVRSRLSRARQHLKTEALL